jgi:adenosylhomocysteine nucleosidase
VLGVVAALSGEATCLAGTKPSPGSISSIGADTLVVVCGMGADAASSASNSLLAHGASALLSWGTAGALSSKLLPGNLVAPTQVTDGHDVHSVHHAWHTRLVTQLQSKVDICQARLLSTRTVIDSPTEKTHLSESTGAVAVDMESFAVATVAALATVPFLALRAIVDPVDFIFPKAALIGADQYGQPKWLALGQALLRQPLEILQLIALGRCFAHATATLRHVAKLAGPEFGWSDQLAT